MEVCKMNDKERFRDIKLKTNNTESSMLFIPKTEVEWLIEQAETAERYKKALTKIGYENIEGLPYSSESSRVAKKALEDDVNA